MRPRALINAGADHEKQTAKGSTALIFACQNGHEPCARALIEKGASLNAVSKDNFTMLMAASCGGLVSVIKQVLPLSEIDAAGNVVKYAPGGNSRSMYDYEDVEALASTLRSGDIALLRGSYLLKLRASGGVLPLARSFKR